MQIFHRIEASLGATCLESRVAIRRDGSLATAADAQPADAVGWLVADRCPSLPRRAVLLAPDGDVLLNGRPPLPMNVLRRGDEIRVAKASLYFTDEDPLRVVAFDPDAFPMASRKCSRCHRALTLGEPVVVCPCCGLLYMAQPDKSPNCWGFGPCIGCKREPAVDFVWQPHEEPVATPWWISPQGQVEA
jgi:hypothetical protein